MDTTTKDTDITHEVNSFGRTFCSWCNTHKQWYSTTNGCLLCKHKSLQDIRPLSTPDQPDNRHDPTTKTNICYRHDPSYRYNGDICPLCLTEGRLEHKRTI